MSSELSEAKSNSVPRPSLTIKRATLNPLPTILEAALERVLLLDRLNEVYAGAHTGDSNSQFTKRVLESLNVGLDVSEQDLGRVPEKGTTVVVANHPFGAIEALALISMLRSVRTDVKIMANLFLGGIPELDDTFILVDPFARQQPARSNLRGLRESIRHLRKGGLLAVFPAGEVAHLTLRERRVTESPWSSTIARIIRLTNATAIPVFFDGTNSPLFQLLGLAHPYVRTALLPREFLNKRGAKIKMLVGTPIPVDRLVRCGDDSAAIDYLRHRTLLLAHRAESRSDTFDERQTRHPEAIVAETPADILLGEINTLRAEQALVRTNEYVVFHAAASQIPRVLREIGRLREITFRECGEGTFKSIDLDEFDQFYTHLFLWSRENSEVAGAYRMGWTDEILSLVGKRGLYTSTLFEYGAPFLRRIGPALELGRSFIRREYQHVFGPLFLLWKGIGRLLVGNPRYRFLFGPVSISSQYNSFSRCLMMEFLSRNKYISDLSDLVRPSVPVQLDTVKGLSPKWMAARLGSDLDDLSEAIAEIEGDNKGLPVLLKHYLKLGGELAGFNLDPKFSNVIDGLMVVDLVRTRLKLLQRIMGEREALVFLDHHDRGGGTGRNVSRTAAGFSPHPRNVRN